MRPIPKILYLLCFLGLAAAAALALNRAVQPSMSDILLRAVVAASFAGAPGLVHRKAWPVALLLLPLGAYLLLRTTVPLPELAEGLRGQYAFYSEQLREGGAAYLEDIFPLKIGDVPGLRLLIAFAVYLGVGAAAFLALSLRKAIPGIAILIVLLGFSLTVDEAARVLWLAVLFLVLAACLLVLSRGLQRSGWRLRDALAGGVVGGTAALLAIVLLGAAPSAVATPWQDWRSWDPFEQGGTVYTFNWMQNYPKLLDPANDQDIMRVESPKPSYWRANALDVFTGTAWVTSQAFLERSSAEQTPRGWVYTVPPAAVGPPGNAVTEVFHIEAAYTNYLFTGGDPLEVQMADRVALRLNDMRSLHVSKALGPVLDYSLLAVIPELDPEALIGTDREYPSDVISYLSLPFPQVSALTQDDKDAQWRSLAPEAVGPDGWEWADLYAVNEQIVGDATDPYDVTLRIEKTLREQFDYSLTPPESDYSSPYAAFLLDTQTGYCQHFAGTMAFLLRYNGIPARVAVGFTSGDRQGTDTYLVSTGNAHAWVEVYFHGVGWVAFDPTPGRSIPVPGPSSSSPGFVNPFSESGDSESATITTEPREARDPGGLLPEDEQRSSATGAGWGTRWVPWLTALVALLIVWPLGRSLWRRRGLLRGLPPSRVSASLALLRADLIAHGVPASPASTLDDVARLIASHLQLHPEEDFVDRMHAVLFGGRPAAPSDLARAERFRAEVGKALRRRNGWMRTILSWYGVPRPARLQGGLPSPDIQ